MLCELAAHGCCIARFYPFHFVADYHRRDANLQSGSDGLQVIIGKHDATVACPRGSAVCIRGRTMNPDAKTATPIPSIPFVGIVDGEGSATIKISKFLPGYISSDKINADGGFLVSFLQFLGPILAAADVIIGEVARMPSHILVYI